MGKRVKFMSLTSPIRMLRVSHAVEHVRTICFLSLSLVRIFKAGVCAVLCCAQRTAHTVASMKCNKFLLCYKIYKQVVCSLLPSPPPPPPSRFAFSVLNVIDTHTHRAFLKMTIVGCGVRRKINAVIY